MHLWFLPWCAWGSLWTSPDCTDSPPDIARNHQTSGAASETNLIIKWIIRVVLTSMHKIKLSYHQWQIQKMFNGKLWPFSEGRSWRHSSGFWIKFNQWGCNPLPLIPSRSATDQYSNEITKQVSMGCFVIWFNINSWKYQPKLGALWSVMSRITLVPKQDHISRNWRAVLRKEPGRFLAYWIDTQDQYQIFMTYTNTLNFICWYTFIDNTDPHYTSNHHVVQPLYVGL